MTELETAIQAAREEHAQAKGEVARLQAELTSAASERGRLESQHAGALSERAQVTQRREASQQKAAEARRHIEEHRAAARKATAEADSLASELKQKQDDHEKAARESARANRELSEARLELAMATERRSNAAARERECAARVADLERRIKATEDSSRALDIVRLRVDPLHDRYDAVHERALDVGGAPASDRASLAEADSDSLKRTIGDAKEAVSAASAALESAKTCVNEVKVDMGRLEVQVEGAINAITATGAVLDEALRVPEPEDRDAAEREVASLRSQIEGIGPVNEVAMDEYLRLKERADYIGEQVADLESARSSLKKINAAIDRKMTNQFLLVFDKVNENFSEIFSLLFPGGQAHIEMTDPENLSETGIEVVAQPRGKRLDQDDAHERRREIAHRPCASVRGLQGAYRARSTCLTRSRLRSTTRTSPSSSTRSSALKESTQLIVISHQRRTMEQADVLYGVSMQADGVSHVVSQRLDRTTGKVVDA